MPWFLLILGLLAVAAWGITRLGSVSAVEARAMLQDGAVVLDVRTPGEFAADALPGTINVPLDHLHAHVASVVPDPATPVLLHCQSGGRSGLACKMLRRMGYARVGNLGSLARAAAILNGAPRSRGS